MQSKPLRTRVIEVRETIARAVAQSEGTWDADMINAFERIVRLEHDLNMSRDLNGNRIYGPVLSDTGEITIDIDEPESDE